LPCITVDQSSCTDHLCHVPLRFRLRPLGGAEPNGLSPLMRLSAFMPHPILNQAKSQGGNAVMGAYLNAQLHEPAKGIMRDKPCTSLPPALSPAPSTEAYRGGHKPPIPIACGHAKLPNRTSFSHSEFYSPTVIPKKNRSFQKGAWLNARLQRAPPHGLSGSRRTACRYSSKCSCKSFRAGRLPWPG
jgi:hypothetical protein